jgi:hypothetical protein
MAMTGIHRDGMRIFLISPEHFRLLDLETADRIGETIDVPVAQPRSGGLIERVTAATEPGGPFRPRFN